MNWQYFILGIIAWQIIKMLALAINREVIERRQRKFLKLVSVTFPDKKDITFIAVDSSDKRSMQKMEQHLRENYVIPD
jgi:RNase P protein component